MVPDAIETIVGLRWSDEFGPMVMFGMGGIFVELLKDVSLRIAPVTEHEALEMVNELKTAKMFENFRGTGKSDIEALAKTIAAVSQMGAQLGENLLELDINPLFVLKDGQGVMAGDALAVVRNN
jgi:acyl-CoA synthetase (NDP forming)